jgi:hypothetical protein
MKFVKTVLWILMPIIVTLDASWLWAAFGAPRSEIRELIQSVPDGLTVIAFDNAVNLGGGVAIWKFRVPAATADALRRRCFGPAALQEIPMKAGGTADTSRVAAMAKSEKAVAVAPSGCTIAFKSYGPGLAEIWLVLQGNVLQLGRGI